MAGAIVGCTRSGLPSEDKPKDNTSTCGSGNNDGGSGGYDPGTLKPPGGVTTGGDGLMVTTDNGTQFACQNPFVGTCPYVPFSPGVQGGDLTVEPQGSGIWRIGSMTTLNRIHAHRL